MVETILMIGFVCSNGIKNDFNWQLKKYNHAHITE